jgi:hypothetical protein
LQQVRGQSVRTSRVPSSIPNSPPAVEVRVGAPQGLGRRQARERRSGKALQRSAKLTACRSGASGAPRLHLRALVTCQLPSRTVELRGEAGDLRPLLVELSTNGGVGREEMLPARARRTAGGGPTACYSAPLPIGALAAGLAAVAAVRSRRVELDAAPGAPQTCWRIGRESAGIFSVIQTPGHRVAPPYNASYLLKYSWRRYSGEAREPASLQVEVRAARGSVVPP